MAYYDPRLGILRRPPPQQAPFNGVVRPVNAPSMAEIDRIREGTKNPQGELHFDIADLGNNMAPPGQQWLQRTPEQLAEAEGLAGLAPQGQAPGLAGPLAALQDSFAAGNPAGAGFAPPAMAPGMAGQVPGMLGNLLSPPPAPTAPMPASTLGPTRGPIGGGNLMGIFNPQPQSAYPPRRRRRSTY